MPEGPLGGPRPAAVSKGEVNIDFQEVNISQATVDSIEELVDNMFTFDGPVKGPVGELNNVVTFKTTGNQITMEELNKLKDSTEEVTGKEVGGIEVLM